MLPPLLLPHSTASPLCGPPPMVGILGKLQAAHQVSRHVFHEVMETNVTGV